ncbi:MAG: phosphoadenylyl-sulfate reductase [Deltaproteobacteria bacterium]|nr:phosphoadenylyl-sulfate reductase [Deltaproteobacteria bacterium]
MKLEDIHKIADIGEAELAEIEKLTPEAMVRFAFENFGKKAAIGTSFQLTGAVIVDMAAAAGLPFRVFTVDTLRLHPETYAAMNETETRYKVKVERFAPKEDKVKEMTEEFGEYLFFTSKAMQEYCCNVRKVEPNERAMATLDVWITGLRKDQSEHRKKSVERASIVEDGGRKILKLVPLADWTEADVKKYIKENNVPYNELFDKGYDSIGCVICSTPLVKGEKPRSGRWRWFSQDDAKECGIHTRKGGSKGK